MRLDKYLKVSRLIKRRTIAKNVSLNERILVNDIPKKPSYLVKIGDVIKIIYNDKELAVKVTSLSESTKKNDAILMFEIISE